MHDLTSSPLTGSFAGSINSFSRSRNASRAYSLPEAERRVRGLQCMWLSHRHADHHVGVPLILSIRRRLLGEDAHPLPVFGPWPLRRVLSACNKIEPLAYQWIDQYLLCSQEQAEAKDLMYFWTKAAECKQEDALNNVLAVRATTSLPASCFLYFFSAKN
jgi:ribonuclease BN (tRNA processing enzyme)